MEIQTGQVYRHYKGKDYKVLGMVRHSETLEELVYYECLYENDKGRFWVRPLDNFLSNVTIDGVEQKRFAPLKENQ